MYMDTNPQNISAGEVAAQSRRYYNTLSCYVVCMPNGNKLSGSVLSM